MDANINSTMLISEASQAKLEELRESGDFARIDISSDYAYEWRIDLAWSDVSEHRPDGIQALKPVHPPEATSRSLDDVIEAAYDYWKKNRKA